MWHCYGHGFDCSKATNEKLADFCKKHEDALAGYGRILELNRLLEGIENSSADAIDFTEVTDNGTVGEIIAHVIQKETNVTVCSTGLTDEGDDVVMFMEMYPWHMTDEDRGLKDAEALYELLKPYAKELDAEDTLGDFDLVYSG